MTAAPVMALARQSGDAGALSGATYMSAALAREAGTWPAEERIAGQAPGEFAGTVNVPA
jgi:hypothetical protein